MFSAGTTVRQQVDARLVIHAGIEEHVVANQVGQQRALHVLGQATVAPPVIRHRPAAVRNDHPQPGEIREQIGLQELHEGGGVRVQVVRTRRMEIRIAGGADVHHRRHVELDELS